MGIGLDRTESFSFRIQRLRGTTTTRIPHNESSMIEILMQLRAETVLLGLNPAAGLVWWLTPTKKRNTLKRRLSFASLVQSRQELRESAFGSPQQIIAAQLFFEDGGAPSREKLLGMGRTIMNPVSKKYSYRQ